MTLLEQLNQLAPLAAAATPGRWNVSSYKDEYPEVFGPNGNTVHQCITSIADAAFTAAARNVLTRENLTLLVAALAAPVAGEADLLLLVTEACNAWASMDNADDMSFLDKTGEQDSADLLGCLRSAGLSISLSPAPAL